MYSITEKQYLQTGHTYLIGNIWCVIWRDSKIKPYNHPITAVYKTLNYNICDDLTSENNLLTSENDLSRRAACGAPYIYDIRSLRVNDLTIILLTWRKW